MAADEVSHTFTGAALYSKAYQLGRLRLYPGWAEVRENWNPDRLVTGGDDPPRNWAAERQLGDEQVVFLHDDLEVTVGSVRGENVLFRSNEPQWRQFCIDKLGFRIPEDLLYRLTAQAPK